MTKKSLVDCLIVKDFLTKVGGDYAIKLVKICEQSRKAITDEQIGKKLPIKITEIRTVLNRLHYRGIANYQKTRNNKTGWYSYTWSINKLRIAEIILDQQVEELEKLDKKLGFEEGYNFYRCRNKCQSLQFEIAAEYRFNCPNCGTIMHAVDNKNALRDIKKRINNINKEIEVLKAFVK